MYFRTTSTIQRFHPIAPNTTIYHIYICLPPSTPPIFHLFETSLILLKQSHLSGGVRIFFREYPWSKNTRSDQGATLINSS